MDVAKGHNDGVVNCDHLCVALMSTVLVTVHVFFYLDFSFPTLKISAHSAVAD